jgi:hypothetical protein
MLASLDDRYNRPRLSGIPRTLDGRFYVGGRCIDGLALKAGCGVAPRYPKALAAQTATRKGRFPVVRAACAEAGAADRRRGPLQRARLARVDEAQFAPASAPIHSHPSGAWGRGSLARMGLWSESSAFP